MSTGIPTGQSCTIGNSILRPISDGVPNPCFLKSTLLLSQIVLGVFVFYQLLNVLTRNHYGPHRIRYSFGNPLSVRSVGLAHFSRVILATLYAVLLGCLYSVLSSSFITTSTQSVFVPLVITVLFVIPLQTCETTRSVIAHGSLLFYWLISTLIFGIIASNDLLSSKKVYATGSERVLHSLALTSEVGLVVLSASLLVLESLFYAPSRELLDYFYLNEWDPSVPNNVLQELSLSWVTPILKAYSRKGSEEITIPVLLPEQENETTYSQFQLAWKKEIDRATWWRDRRRGQKTDSVEADGEEIHPHLLLVILKLHWASTLEASVLQLFDILDVVGRPFLMQKFIKLFYNGGREYDPLIEGIFIAVSFFVLLVLGRVSKNRSDLLFRDITQKVTSALTTAVFVKATKLSLKARKEKTNAEIVNHISIDVGGVAGWLGMLSLIVSVPLQLIFTVGALYKLLGNFIWVGFAILVLMMPLSGFAGASLSSIFKNQLKFKDKRVKLTSDILSSIRSVKFYCWEKPLLKRLGNLRNENELQFQRKLGIVLAAMTVIYGSTPRWVMYSIFAGFGIFSKAPLSPDLVFSSLYLFFQLLIPLHLMPSLISQVSMTKVKSKRLETFFGLEEIPEKDPTPVVNLDKGVRLKDVSARWGSGDSDESGSFAVNGIDLEAKPGDLICIIGKVGSGKTSLLKTILGELEVSPESSLLVAGKIAYCAQDPWILNTSIKKNILFGRRYSPELYYRVIDACQLTHDFEVLPHGDLSVVGDKGISLSGGQKARISLARAVYASADIYLLDDVLSAVDSHVGKKITEALLSRKGLLRNKTVILATNAIRVLDEATNVKFMKNGAIVEEGTFEALKNAKGEISQFISTIAEKEGKNVNDSQSDEGEASLASPDAEEAVQTEEITSEHELPPLDRVNSHQTIGDTSVVSFGHKYDFEGKHLHEEEKRGTSIVEYSVLVRFLKACNYHYVAFWCSLSVGQIAMGLLSTWILKKWSENNLQYGNNSNVVFYLLFLAAFNLLVSVIDLATSYVQWSYCQMSASKSIHDDLSKAVLGAPISFFDTTPTGRILNRFTSDMGAVDLMVLSSLGRFFSSSMSSIISLLVIVFNLPVLLVVILALTFLFLKYRQLYILASRDISRLTSALNSPIMSHFQESLNGLETIRAYKEEGRFSYLLAKLADEKTKVSLFSGYINKWLSLRLSLISSLIVLASMLLCLSTVYTKNPLSAGMVGFLLTSAFSSTEDLNSIISNSADVENRLVAIERIFEYTDLAQEESNITKRTQIQHTWPANGSVLFEKYSASYRPGLPSVLNELDVEFKPGERVGIVGRTGAGKSSLALSIFRFIEADQGRISIDGVDIATLGLHDLRSQISIIPQDAHLFGGTVRENLDPLGEFQDTELWKALELAHLKDHIESLENSSEQNTDVANQGNDPDSAPELSGLDAKVDEGGSNFSGGQKQLMCLARALLKESKIIILDEATAAVDVATDEVIQKTLRERFEGKTILTIAHRLNTVMDYNRILVLEGGRVKEFDTPQNLLKDEKSEFSALCKEAGLVAS